MLQGYAEATECRAEDNYRYVVKHGRAGLLSLVREWIAGKIGVGLGLPIPPFEILYLERSRVGLMAHRDARKIANQPCFGSRWVDQSSQLVPDDLDQISPELRARILLFDWWIMNGDRTESNTNLLWVAHEQKLHVIDHNQAFDDTDPSDFWGTHLFKTDWILWNEEFRNTILPLMVDQRSRLPEYWKTLPDEWLELGEEVVPSIEVFDEILSRFEDNPADFWGTP